MLPLSCWLLLAGSIASTLLASCPWLVLLWLPACSQRSSQPALLRLCSPQAGCSHCSFAPTCKNIL